MERIRLNNGLISEGKPSRKESFYSSLTIISEEKILSKFTEEEQKEILRKKEILSPLGFFIAKDFNMVIELNEAGKGWHWDFEKNIIRIDPKTLLEAPIEKLRYLICHEGGHRRISRVDFIPLEVWRQTGFSNMMNFIEDPRNDNFVVESYPKYKENVDFAWNNFFENKKKIERKAEENLGFQPRFVQAGYEYIKQWFREIKGENFEISEDLPEEVKEVVRKTLESAQDSWWRYPSRKEADESEKKIREYAEVSYEINRDEIWPEFKKLVDADLEDQKTQEVLQDMIKEMMKELRKQAEEKEKEKKKNNEQKPSKGDGENGEGENKTEKKESSEGNLENQDNNGEKEPLKPKIPGNLNDKLTLEEQKELENAISKAVDEANKKREEKNKKSEEGTGEKNGDAEGEEGGDQDIKNENRDNKGEHKSGNGKSRENISPVNLSKLSEEIKKKIKDYIDLLPEEQKKEIEEKAQKALKELEDAVNEELGGKLSENPEQKEEREKKENEDKNDHAEQNQGGAPVRTGTLRKDQLDLEGMRVYKERLKRETNKDENIYDKYRREIIPLIDKLENDLREILVDRKATKWRSGFKTGKRVDIKRRIQEKAKGISVMESDAWQRREKPDEREYSISILNDLSGSMRKKIEEDFKAKIVLAEALNKLGINMEINGFNDEIYEYQKFGESMSKETREHMGGMFREVEDSCCKNCGNEHNETDIGWAMETASKRLLEQKTNNKIIIVFTDDRPAESSKHPSGKYKLKDIKDKISNDEDIKMIYYPLTADSIKVDKIIEDVSKLLRKVIVDNGKV